MIYYIVVHEGHGRNHNVSTFLLIFLDKRLFRILNIIAYTFNISYILSRTLAALNLGCR